MNRVGGVIGGLVLVLTLGVGAASADPSAYTFPGHEYVAYMRITPGS